MKAWSKRAAQVGLALALALASGVAAALGLGQLELKSRLGEPLLAEIPIISNDPAELRQLRAGLASPETFARIGLEPPDQVVANLQFASALDAQGNPVIRVTSTQPITQPLLTFLVEVDWGQGRLVREYSALLDTPRTVAAPLQAPIQAPTAAPSNTIVREPVAPEPASPAEPQIEPEPPSEQTPAPVAAQPVPAEPEPTDAIAGTPPPMPAAAPPQPQPRPTEYGEVQRGETLSEIAEQLDLGVSLDQAMIALLRANPEAFIGGNINLLKQGVVLRLPDREELAAVDAIQASALVRSQVRQWRQAKQAAVPQPAAVADAASSDGAASETAQADGSGTEQAAPASGARLEIIPPGASDASEAGTQSGIAAGGEGNMQRELATTKETLAAREAELAEMKSRVADLEQLQSKQQQLLEMKDSELAAVQQRLAQSNEDADAAGMSSMPWLIGGAVLVLLALLAGWLLGRRAKTPEFRGPRQSGARKSSVADSFAPATAPVSPFSATATPKTAAPDTTASEAPAKSVEATAVADTTPPKTDDAPPATQDEPMRPSWERSEPPGKRAPTWHQGASPPAAGMASSIPTADVPAQERLELARAYIDLGDHDSARQLLREVAGNGDAPARQQAERMLRELE